MTKIQTLVENCNNKKFLKETWQEARERKKNSFKPGHKEYNYKNTCAATASVRLQKSGIISGLYLLTGELLAAILKKPCSKVSTEEIKPGDICFCVDLNNNKQPDHAVIAISEVQNGKIKCVDNQKAGQPYWRDINSTNYTPLAYAIRINL